jgi:hypothetical protein
MTPAAAPYDWLFVPAHSFLLTGLAGAIAAVCLFPLFALVPVFALAWLADLFDFRRHTFAFQLALSVPLSPLRFPR